MKRITSILLLLLASIAGADDQKPSAGLGYVPLTPEKRKYFQNLSHAKHGQRLSMMAKNQALPAAYDVRSKVPLPVWDQGNCGSCYLVATVRTATSMYIGLGYGKADNSFKLSDQFGMDRPRDFGGCNGGNGTEVVAWMVQNGWPAETYIDLAGMVHKDYPPYEARSGNDREKVGAKRWMKGADWGFVNANGRPTIVEIKAGIYNYGRLNIALDAGGQFSNGTGTITVLGTQINHEINAVAYDDNHDNGDGTKGAFLLENQWNRSYGIEGCRWCSYNAAARIVDWFYVTAAPLPPPPPDPVPPTPGEGDSITITTYVGGVTSVKTYFINGTPSGKTVPDATPQELIDALRKIYGSVTVPATSPVKPVQTPEPPLIEKKVFPPLPIKLDLDAMYPATTQANKDSLRKLLEGYDVFKIDREVKITPRATTTPVIRNHPSTADLLLLEVRRLQEQLESNQRFIRETLKP